MSWGQAGEVELLSSEVFLTSQGGLQLCIVTGFDGQIRSKSTFWLIARVVNISLVFVIASHRQQTLSSPRLSYSTHFCVRPWPTGVHVAAAELLRWLFLKGKSEILSSL